MTPCDQPISKVDEKPPKYQTHPDAGTKFPLAHFPENDVFVIITASAELPPDQEPSPTSSLGTIWGGFLQALHRPSADPVTLGVHVVVNVGASEVVGSRPSIPPEVIGVVPHSLLRVLIPLTPRVQAPEFFARKFWHTLLDAFRSAQLDGSVPRLEAVFLKCYYDWRLNFSADAFRVVQRDGSVARLEAALLKSYYDWRLVDGQARCWV
ncbi:uncharacterized protein BXZ73DRAFT_105855 [Epithele typhae]|uniref:uncharacterized protein n=1 Tax=Epithele typhae TaxID=378194 RepID=UPI0020082D4F|nr:uncharacterized protein BXZ73DRAFT_105855 [Epithele typhae]KAH9916417.1 hypothetical protein BXZ73DRAFT_105855 [Epithele typhae]